MNFLIRKYQRLLIAEESISAFEESLALVQKVAKTKIIWKQGDMEFHRIKQEELTHKQLHAQMSESLQEFDWPQFQAAMGRRLKNRERIQLLGRALKGSVALAVIPSLVRRDHPNISHELYSLLLDSSMVLFHQAYFALLPMLEKQNMSAARDALLSSFRQFADHLARLSDKYNVLGLYYDATGDVERAAEFMRESLRATHSDEHEFMTSLQTCWTMLADQKKFREALDLLLETYPRVPRQDLQEVHELIATTFQLQREHYESLMAS